MTKTALEFNGIDNTVASTLAKELFKFPFVGQVVIDENYVSVTKYDISDWSEMTLELRTFIKEFIENSGTAVDESKIVSHPKVEKQKIENFDKLDTTSQEIINILEKYVKPAVAADGGNILFDTYDPIEKRVKAVLQGTCNGISSPTFTLKSGIENMLKDEDIKVKALNG